jgi:hypothetical protein
MTDEAILMDREKMFTAFAHQVAFYMVDPEIALKFLLAEHAKDFPNHDPAQAEARLRGILRLES